MAFTKEQRLLVLMAIACMGLAVVSAGCVDTDDRITDSYRFKLNKKANPESDLWCSCAMNHTVNYTEKCDDQSFYEKANSIVNCTSLDDFKDLVNPLGFCPGFEDIIANLPTAPSPSATPENPKADDPNSSPNATETNPPKLSNATETNPLKPNATETNPLKPNATEINPTKPNANDTNPLKPSDTTTHKPTASTTQNPITTTTSEPETGPTYLYWLIPLIVVLLVAMFLLGCYLHRRTKGSRGFHHSTKTNGSTKATNGEA